MRDGVFYAYDPVENSWTSAAMQIQGGGGPIGDLAFHALDFDPVDGVFLFLTGYDSGSRMWAYRFADPRLFADGFESGDTAAWSAVSPLD